ncbi:response regulator [Streptomyces sp. MS1.AVA.1]|uniref:Response regulator n=1 Tax=Streptomyces machairae TaxID=3134109 RepID=A0ABU8UHF7_9ACTN
MEPDYDVLLAADGRAALEMALAQPVELVLSDVMMPRMDGFELVRALRADPRTARLPIVLLTARAGEEESVRGRQAGADDYLAKPFSARQLLARVRTGLELSRLREQVLTETRNQLAVLASLADAGLRLSATLDPDQILQTVGQILLPDFADQISIHLTTAKHAPAQSPPEYIAGTPLLPARPWPPPPPTRSTAPPRPLPACTRRPHRCWPCRCTHTTRHWGPWYWSGTPTTPRSNTSIWRTSPTAWPWPMTTPPGTTTSAASP